MFKDDYLDIMETECQNYLRKILRNWVEGICAHFLELLVVVKFATSGYLVHSK